MKNTLRPSFLAPITDTFAIDFSGVAAIIMRNAGTATVSLANGNYTLDPKETLSLNVTELGADMILDSIAVNFDTSTGSVKKLQVIIIFQSSC